MWLKRCQQEYDAGNRKVIPTTKMYTMACDAYAKSNGGRKAAERAEEILGHMHNLYQRTKQENLRPTTGIFNAVINAWARSRGGSWDCLATSEGCFLVFLLGFLFLFVPLSASILYSRFNRPGSS